MGKSDVFVLHDYVEMTKDLRPKRAAFLGSTKQDAFSSTFCCEKDFYDIQLGNWNINSAWELSGTYDFIACTRCAYFAADPDDFIKRCKAHLDIDGKLFVDWGLGDHWRFNKYKVGWVRDGEHEWACFDGNFLHSCMWREEFSRDPVVEKFWNAVCALEKAGYDATDSIDAVVRREVPRIVDYRFSAIRFRYLWPEQPQLYIMTLL
jgi:hypothetical protein